MVVNASPTWPWSSPVTRRKQPAAAADNPERSSVSSPRLMVMSSGKVDRPTDIMEIHATLLVCIFFATEGRKTGGQESGSSKV